MKALKLNFRTKDVELIRHEIRSYSSAMQMTLHMVGICLTIDGNKQAQTAGIGLEEKLTSLAAQITDVQAKISQSDDVESNQDKTIVADDTEFHKHATHLKKHVDAAREVFSNGSVYAGSIAGTVKGDDVEINHMTHVFGSVIGIDEQRRRQIDDWRGGESLAEEAEDEDDEGDVERDMFRARLSLAQKKLAANDYKAAEKQFLACLKNTTLLNSLPPHEVTDIRLEYSLACQGSGNFAGEQSALEDMLKGDIDKAQMLHLQHRLATSYFRGGSLPAAQRSASEAMKGHRKLLGPRDQSYLETVKLLVDICKAQNNIDDAEMYESLLPYDFEAEKSTDPVNSSEDAAAIELLSRQSYTLGDKSSYFEALRWASWCSADTRPAIVRLLLRHGTDLHGTDTEGWTMLMHAARHGFADIAETLIEKGADANAEGKYGNTALHIAAGEGHKDVVRTLIDHGVSVELTDKTKGRSLHRAAAKGQDAIVTLLLDRGAEINARGSQGFTPLGDATRFSRLSTIRLLLDRGADPNAGSDSNYTPLMSASGTSSVTSDTVPIVELLLARGPIANLKDLHSNTALSEAKRRNNKAVMKLLKSKQGGFFR